MVSTQIAKAHISSFSSYRFKLILFATLLCYAWQNCIMMSLAYANNTISTNSELSRIEDITNTIVKQELALLSLDTKFRIENFKSDKLKPWRIFTYKLAASGLTEAGITTVAISRWKYYDHPSLTPQGLLEAGPICNLTAANIVLGGTALEGVLDKVHDYRIRKAGLDAKTALRHFVKVRSEIDSLLTERNNLVCTSDLSNTQRQIVETDGAVLQDIRNLASLQFANYYAREKRTRVGRDAGTLLTIAGAGTGGYIGSLNSLLAASNHNPKQAGVAGIGFVISGLIVALTPLFIRAAEKTALYSSDRKTNKLMGGLNRQSPEAFEADRLHLVELIAKVDKSDLSLMTGLSARTSAYELEKAILDSQDNIALKQAEQRNHSLHERLLFSSLVGGTNAARGLQLVVAGFKYPNMPTDAYKLTAAASTTYMVGAGAWIIDTLQGRLRAELLAKKAKAAKSSTQTQLKERLQSIEELKEVIDLY